MNPVKIEWFIPKDKYGRPAVLTRERRDGGDEWSIQCHAINQRDDGWVIHGLTTEQLKVIAEIVKDMK